MDTKTERYEAILRETLDAALERDYEGYGKFDALESPIINSLSFGNKWLRLFFTQAVKECPFHIRPLLGVKQSRNPKGIALFARAWLFRHLTSGDARCLEEAESLLGWLLDHPSPGCKNLAWGYNFLWQNTIFLQDRNEPNVVVTIFAGEALMHAYRITRNPRYLEGAVSAARFITADVPVLYEDSRERAIAYVLRKVDAVVLNNNALAGAFLAKVWKETADSALLETARKLLRYTANKRTDYYAWYYTHPRERSPITHDNYHTGGILDAFLEFFEETGDDEFTEVYRKGLDFYGSRLFEQDGAPRWMHDRKYPHDVHGSAQGIVSFAKAGRYDRAYYRRAETVADWAIQHLYRPDKKDFAYRKGKIMTWNYSLMRWCNAWMTRALGELVEVSRARKSGEEAQDS